MATESMELTITLQHLASMYRLMHDNKDEKNASKIIELFEKLDKNEFAIGFTGHFSAGKSSMINALLGKEILPKSPIPTSANIVKITSGKGTARVFFRNESPVEYKEPYDIEMIKDYCKDKDTINKIELSTSNKILPEGCMILDTPGIDAADDADRLMTESSLHLVDVLFYVMDYNHVQSDVNLHFLKKIQANGIPVYIIINQIDKHDETEIAFQAFEKSIKQTFEQWKITPNKIFYSSLIDRNVEHNQFNKIKEKLFHLLTIKGKSNSTVSRALKQVIEKHKQFLSEVYKAKAFSGDEIFTENDLIKLEKINVALSNLKQRPEQLRKEFQNDLNTTLKNAYIMPAEIRDQATLFLESKQKGFKVGMFGSRKKTNQEISVRLSTFLQALQKSIEAAIQWKLRDKFMSFVQKHNITEPELLKQTQQIGIEYTTEDLLSLVKPGATVSGAMVLNYTNDVGTDIKNKYKKEAHKLWDKINQEVIRQTNKKATEYEAEKMKLEKANDQYEEQMATKSKLQEKYFVMDQQLKGPTADQDTWKLIQHAIEKTYKPVKLVNPTFHSIKANTVKKDKIKQKLSDEQISQRSTNSVIQSIETTIKTVEALPGFQTIVNDLVDKKNRFKRRSPTVALFGAFSAGKSSFANALLGESLLPVSPNPTTAVINRITPVTEKYEHGTVIITLKSDETLVADLLSITKHLSPPPVTEFADLIDWIKMNRVDQSTELDAMYQAFLHALIIGYKDMGDSISNTITISIANFARYVTDEAKACYIDSVDLYYDCSFTKLGITLVDTPGADSVNARHTNVAFDYIKHADAILYVTYYNHALSRADKDFLTQLGRVKETFHLDKMFFIINAADLAQNNSDLDLVMNYVEENLLELGIRFPKIFPVSSKLSLENKINKDQLNKEMHAFESAFYQFINDDLAALSIQSALWDIHRAYKGMLQYEKTVHLNEQEKEAYRKKLHETCLMLGEIVDKTDGDLYEERIIQRIEKQLYYVQERLSIRFHDMFKEEFNPTTISESGKKAHKQLEKSLQSLLDYTGYELLQELRAVSLRIEAYLSELTKDVYMGINNRTKSLDNNFILPVMDKQDLETPKFEQAFIAIDYHIFDKALRRFNGTKAFFVNNEKETMKEEIYTKLIPHIKQYIDSNVQIMEEAYLLQWNELFTTIKRQIKINISNYLENNLFMVTETIDVNQLKEKKRILKSLIGIRG